MSLLPAFRRISLLWLPVLFVLLARGAVAPGWMLDRSDAGTLTVRICSDVSGAGKTIDIPFERKGGHASADKQHCSWGALAGAPPLGEVAALPARMPDLPRTAAPPSSVGFAPGIASPLPPSTGPPTLA